MLNQIVIVGRLVKDPELKITEGGKKISSITLAVPRSYKNMNGTYDTDLLIVLFGQELLKILQSTVKKEIPLVEEKGRLQTKIIEKDDGTKER